MSIREAVSSLRISVERLGLIADRADAVEVDPAEVEKIADQLDEAIYSVEDDLESAEAEDEGDEDEEDEDSEDDSEEEEGKS